MRELTDRQLEVALKFSTDKPISAIVTDLERHPTTIRNHLKAVKDKLALAEIANLREFYTELQQEQARRVANLLRVYNNPKPIPDSSTASSRWTGKTTPKEFQKTIVHVTPILIDGLDSLVQAVEEKRLNDPDVEIALGAAKELHHSLGELIHMVEKAHHKTSSIVDRTNLAFLRPTRFATRFWASANVRYGRKSGLCYVSL